MSITTNHRHVVTVPVELAPVDPRAVAVSFLTNCRGPILEGLTESAREWMLDTFQDQEEDIQEAGKLDIWATVAKEYDDGIEGFTRANMAA